MAHSPPAPVPTIAEALQRVTQRHYLVGNRSMRTVCGVIRNHLLPTFGALPLTALTAERLEMYAASLRALGKKPSTINKVLQPIRAAFALYATELALHIPAIPHLPERNAREVFFERVEFERAVAQLRAPLRPPMWFAYFTGWRVHSEVLPLRWDRHVRWDAGLVTLPANEDKNAQAKSFPFDALPELAALLAAQRDRRLPNCPWVFHRFGGKRICSFDGAWRSAIVRSGLDHRVPHDLRRTAARNLLNAGVPEKVVMDLVGWRTVAMLHRYFGKAREADLRSAVAKLAASPSSAPSAASQSAPFHGWHGQPQSSGPDHVVTTLIASRSTSTSPSR